MANQSLAVKRQAVLSHSMRTLLTTLLEELRESYLRMTEDVKTRTGVTSWSFCLFECDIARELDLPEYRDTITPQLIAFFENHGMQVSKRQGYTGYFIITVDLEKRLGLLTEQLCLAY